MRWVLALLLLGSCKPTPPPGAYLCSPGDNACPGSQHCTCGLCVDSDSQAACGFQLTTDPALTAVEHLPFTLGIQALDPTGQPSTFGGTVQLSAAWGDVSPTSLVLQAGSAQAAVTLNRETVQDGDVITVSFAGVESSTDPIPVLAPPFTVDTADTMSPDASFGPSFWAKATRYASVYVGASGGFESVFIGGDGSGGRALGHAVAADDAGTHFIPDETSPIWGPGPDAGCPPDLATVNVYSAGDAGWMLVYSRASTKGLYLASFNQDAPVALDCDGGSCVPQCALCATAGFDPYVVQVPPELDSSCGGPKWLMYFQSQRTIPSGAYNVTALGVATSCDGVHFVPLPLPILVSQDLYSSVVFAPRVLLDGRVYKMWFTYSLDPTNAIATEGFCGPDVDAGIGYATSRDGLTWVPSLANPVITTTAVPFWSTGFTAHTLRATSVVPTDGVDAAHGITLYYTPYTTPFSNDAGCQPGGLARAVRD